MSGGDLDGDVYLCFWDAALVKNLRPENIAEPSEGFDIDKEETKKMLS